MCAFISFQQKHPAQLHTSLTSMLLSENIIILKILSENYLKKIKPRVTYVTKCALQDMEKPSTLLLLKKS